MWLLILKLCLLLVPDKGKAHNTFFVTTDIFKGIKLWGSLVQKFSLPLSIFAFIARDPFHSVNGGKKNKSKEWSFFPIN